MIFFPFEGAVTWPDVNSQRISSLLYPDILRFVAAGTAAFHHLPVQPSHRIGIQIASVIPNRSREAYVRAFFLPESFQVDTKTFVGNVIWHGCFMVDSKNPAARQLRKSQFIHLVDKVEDIVDILFSGAP